MDLTMSIGTDVATICFFHPDDLAAYIDAPMTWYATSYAVAAEFERGRLIAFSTGSDGGFSVRVTDQGLSAREQEYAGASCEYRLTVTRGRVAIDNTDGLPSVEQQSDLNTSGAAWFELDNGTYRATVTAIRWSDEPGAVGDNGRSTEDALTSYVLSLQPVSDLGQVGFPTAFPNVLPDKPEPTFTLDFANEPRLDAEPTLESSPLHVVVTGDRLTAPGHRLTVPMLEKPPDALTFVDVVVTNDHQPGSVGVYGRHRSLRSSNAGCSYGVDVLVPVRIVDTIQDDEWPLCDFEPITIPAQPIGDELRARLLEAFAHHVRVWHLPAAEFQIARMASLPSDRALTNAMIGLLAPEPVQTGWLLTANDQARAETLLAQLTP